jgi:Family of unknown function (DUF5681)
MVSLPNGYHSMADTTAKEQRRRGAGRPFEPGRSGNPAGRPKGSRHRITVLAEQLLEGEAEGLIRKAIKLALAGDVAALRLLVDRIHPPLRDRPVSFSLPPLSTPADAVAAMAAIATAVGEGNLTPTEAAEISALVANVVKTIEVAEIDARVRALEEEGSRTAR